MPAPTVTSALMALFGGLIGLAIGSFAGLCLDRLPRGESIVRPASHCDRCGHRLGTLDLIPFFSWVFLKGRCRYCGERISWRVPALELVCGIACGLITILFVKINS